MLEMVSAPEMSVPRDLLCLDHSSFPQLQVHFKGQKNIFKETESLGRWDWIFKGGLINLSVPPSVFIESMKIKMLLVTR